MRRRAVASPKRDARLTFAVRIPNPESLNKHDWPEGGVSGACRPPERDRNRAGRISRYTFSGRPWRAGSQQPTGAAVAFVDTRLLPVSFKPWTLVARFRETARPMRYRLVNQLTEI